MLNNFIYHLKFETEKKASTTAIIFLVEKYLQDWWIQDVNVRYIPFTNGTNLLLLESRVVTSSCSLFLILGCQKSLIFGLLFIENDKSRLVFWHFYLHKK